MFLPHFVIPAKEELFFSFVVFVPLWFKAFLLFATGSSTRMTG